MDLKLYQIAKNGSLNFSNTYKAVDSEDRVTCEKNTILHIAAKSGNKKSTHQILQLDSSLVHATNTKGETPLHIAARLGHFDVAELLITCARQQRGNESGNNHPLHIVSKKKLTVLHEAVKNNHLNVVDLLIKEDPGLASTTDDSGLASTPDDSGLASTTDDSGLASTPDDSSLASTTDVAVESPLFMAVERGFYEVAVCILEKCPNPSYSGTNGMNIMHAAVLVMPPGFIITMIHCLSQPQLIRLISFSHPVLFLFLYFIELLHRIRNSIINSSSSHSISVAGLKQLLLGFRNRRSRSISGADLLTTVRNFLNRQLFGFRNSSIPSISGTDLFATVIKFLNRPLLGLTNSSIPSISGTDFANKVLEKAGPGILEEKDSFGWTPLHYAAYIGNQDVVKLFLETKRSLAYTKNKEGMSALHIAAQRRCIGVIEKLIQKCPDVSELLDDKDQTALHVAVANGNVHTVMRFLRMIPFNDLLNETTKDGNTCLHVAALQGYDEIVLMLVNDRRVDRTLINNLGMTAADIIFSRKNISLYEKVLFASWVKIGGVHHTSLERRVVRESRMAQLDREKLLKTTQETEIEVPSQDDKTAGPSHTSITTAQENEKGVLAFIDPKIDSRTGRKYNHDHIQNLSTINLLVATIIASITFSSFLQMPGGYNSDGMPNLRKFKTFRIFVLFDSLAFGLSAASMCLHFASPVIAMISGRKYFYPLNFSVLLTFLSICFTLVAFVSARSAVLNEKGKFNFDDLVPFIYSFVVPLVFSIIIYIIKRARAFYVLPFLLPSV